MRQPMDLIPVACGTYERNIATIAAMMTAITNEINEDSLSEDERKKERADSFCVTQERPSALFLTVHRNDKFTKTTYRE